MIKVSFKWSQKVDMVHSFSNNFVTSLFPFLHWPFLTFFIIIIISFYYKKKRKYKFRPIGFMVVSILTRKFGKYVPFRKEIVWNFCTVLYPYVFIEYIWWKSKMINVSILGRCSIALLDSQILFKKKIISIKVLN